MATGTLASTAEQGCREAILREFSSALDDGHSARERRGELVELTRHAMQRCVDRNVHPRKAIDAFRQGEVLDADYGRFMCIRDGCVAIIDQSFSKILSVWHEPAHGIVLKKKLITSKMQRDHDAAVRRARDTSTWQSHTVAVVDQSGSMRKLDMDGVTMRSDVVWLNLAISVVASSLNSKERSDSDMLSVVQMKNSSEVVVAYEPFDWILYNKIVDLLRTSLPGQGGCYKPALETASALLGMSRSRNCALSLIFLSDGRPSDQVRRGDVGSWESKMKRYAKEFVASLAAPIGKRLAICLIGIGRSEADSEFQVLRAMEDEAKQYECPVVFESGCVSAMQLATALTTTGTNTTETKTQLGDHSADEEVRSFVKQPLREVGNDHITDTWKIVQQQCIVDAHGFKKWALLRTRWIEGRGWTPEKAFQNPAATGVAFETRWFGEGKERLAKEFREIDRNERFVGQPLVAKDSIMVKKSSNNRKDAKNFHKKFLRTHIVASEVAAVFNGLIERLGYISFPKLQFLECFVYMIQNEHGEREGYLVEPMLDIKNYKYHKFNDNQGNVLDTRSRRSTFSELELTSISECDENEDDEVEQDEIHDKVDPTSRANDILQSFSCFSLSYFNTRKLVCDLQGIFNERENVIQLTDPVVHSLGGKQPDDTDFGRTNLGQRGIDAFKRSHRCTALCRELRSTFVVSRSSTIHAHQNSYRRQIREFDRQSRYYT